MELKAWLRARRWSALDRRKLDGNMNSCYCIRKSRPYHITMRQRALRCGPIQLKAGQVGTSIYLNACSSTDGNRLLLPAAT